MPTQYPLNPMRARLDAGEVAIGVLVSMPGVAMVQILSRVDIDWIFIDMEHGPIDVESMHAMVAATQGTGVSPIVRVPWNEHWLVKPVIDAGAMGVIFPMIRSAEEATTAAASLRYPPTGVRGFGPFYAAQRFGTPFGAHVDVADRELICQLLIEHRDAVDDIERIVEVAGVAVCQLAPFDLALSYGYRDGIDHAEVHDAIARVEEVVKASPVKLGGLAPSPEGAREMVAQGYEVVLGGIDVPLIQGAVQRVVEAIR